MNIAGNDVPIIILVPLISALIGLIGILISGPFMHILRYSSHGVDERLAFYESLQKEVTSLRDRVDELEQRLSEAMKSLSEAMLNRESLHRELTAERMANLTLARENADLQASVAALKSSVTEVIAQLSEYRRQRNQTDLPPTMA